MDLYLSAAKDLDKRLQRHPELLNSRILDDFARCCTKWPNACNMFDGTLRVKGLGSKSTRNPWETNPRLMVCLKNGSRPMDLCVGPSRLY